MLNLPWQWPVAASELPSGPIGGNLRPIANAPLSFVLKCAELGDFVPLRFFNRGGLFVNEEDAISWILNEGKEICVKPYSLDTSRFRFGDETDSIVSDFWRDLHVVEPAFNRSHLQRYAEVMSAAGTMMLSSWRHGQIINLSDELMRCTLRIAGRTLFSRDLDEYAAEIKSAMHDINDTFLIRLRTLFLVPDALPSRTNLRSLQARSVIDRIVDDIVTPRWRADNYGDDVTGLILRAVDNPEAPPLAFSEVCGQIATFLLAGHDTTAQALTWALHLLALHPEIQEQLYQHISQVLGDRLPAYDDIPDLKRVEWVVHEALRLYPPIWVMGRIAKQDLSLNGQFVPKGTILLLSPLTMHRKDKWFDDPLSFRPDRWATLQKIHRYAYFPFGGGERGCIGSRFAINEAVLLLAMAIQRHHLASATPTTVGMYAAITLRPEPDPQVRVFKR